MNKDIDIAFEAQMKPIKDIAAGLNLSEEDWEPYGHYKAKLSDKLEQKLEGRSSGKIILTTSINPTPAGEGKSTVTVGLGQALNKLNKKAVIALREPSLGPTMGLKGGAAGGGYSQVVPMEEINLHFTGDIHAITSANNALSAFIDNHIHQGNELNIDPRRISWKRVVDLNDRALREVVVGLGGPVKGVPREDGFMISVASEIMAVLCLASDLQDLKERLARMVIGYTYDRKPVTVQELGYEGALTLLLKDAAKPNLVQTLENTPAIIHGGPFANIAHGCNSVKATKMAAKLGDYVVTEAGFGADLGAEKFLDIKTRAGGFEPDAVVIVATIRALKMHGGVDKKELQNENTAALMEGAANLKKHMETIEQFQVPYVIAINEFPTDTKAEIDTLTAWCNQEGAPVSLVQVHEKGGSGGLDLAEKVIAAADQKHQPLAYTYELEDSIEQKIEKIARRIYGAAGVEFSSKAEKQMRQMNNLGFNNLPICMAKTQYSLSDDPSKLGRPEDFTITVRDLYPSIGAGFLVALTGDVMTMPGLPKNPAALQMDVDASGVVKGLF
ncbi:formate--tetrahydrofolate ligase [Halobacillus kuroshimensis]|uniref:Formate--tetrahydrofolate ligase n=1 Tax=Halobacillus kuroshimensis TaxID=302481 RepID=A0ABS3DTH6_9BACI|nr:formate--tetrahydrofolate ligase [Halobacillus kuroshimensis]MBN8234626.1 formate--tetrahydrofolate ligase [Halobacillus kuroshimensis]